MSKLQTINVSKIGWIHANNPRPAHEYFEHEGEASPLADLPESIKDPAKYNHAVKPGGLCWTLLREWDDNQNLRVRKATDDDQEVLDAQYRSYIESCFADEKYIRVGEAMASAYGYKVNLVDGKRELDSKNPHKWQYVGQTGYRRSIGFFGAIALAGMMGESAPIFDVSCVVTDGDSGLVEQLQENLLKGEGVSEMTENSLCYQACQLSQAGLATNENYLFKVVGYKRGAAQRAWGMALLNGQYPELRIAERLNMPRPTPVDNRIPYVEGGYIDATALHKDGPRRLSRDSGAVLDPDHPAKPGEAQAEADVESYIKARMTGEAKTTAVISKKKQAEIVKMGCNKLVAAVVKAITVGDEDRLRELSKLKWNDATEQFAPVVTS